jgi:hypothetical protein
VTDDDDSFTVCGKIIFLRTHQDVEAVTDTV